MSLVRTKWAGRPPGAPATETWHRPVQTRPRPTEEQKTRDLAQAQMLKRALRGG